MSPRPGALLLLLVAALTWAGVVVPARRERDEARDAYARAREERQGVRARVVALERRASVGRTPEAGAAAARSLRASLLGATHGLDLEAITIGASSQERGHYAARGQLSAQGATAELLRLCGRLADVRSGLLVERVDLAEVGREPEARVRLTLAVASVRTAP